MKILCIMHEEFEKPGIIVDWARENHFSFTLCKPFKGDKLDPKDFDFLILMGGPQSPLAMEEAPYSKDEIDLIRTAIKDDKRILGFCLGAQLIGEALGARTEKSPEKELGVYPVFLTEEGKRDPLLLELPQQFNAIHWHNDMPGIPQGAKILAKSEGCPRQIVRFSSKVYGFQCHLEIPLEGIKEMIAACPDDLKPSRLTQTKEVLLTQNYGPINKMLWEILDRWIKH